LPYHSDIPQGVHEGFYTYYKKIAAFVRNSCIRTESIILLLCTLAAVGDDDIDDVNDDDDDNPRS